MSLQKIRERTVVAKFQSLLRSGMDYSVDGMYAEAGEVVFIEPESVRRIVNSYYKDVITHDMIVYTKGLKCNYNDKITCFSRKFEVCSREARLMIRYIKRRKNGQKRKIK